ncbi:MAG: RusA family crossover junction endodeoxyribonuclease [Bacteroidales bacterium]|nr:RusA family crossover junction endodeoxyribonuclease [Bacteroidales bacterium]
MGQVPSKSNSYRIITLSGHGTLGKTATLTHYEKSFYMQIGPYRNLKIDGYFELYLRVYYNSARNDLDNCLKCILDCLQYTRTITNDNRCVRIVAEKFVDRSNPRMEFRLVEV